MAREILINPGKCTGCSSCALTCSIMNGEEFNQEKAFVTIRKDDFAGLFTITFSSACRGCRQCAKACPSGALREIETVEPAKGNHGEGGAKQ